MTNSENELNENSHDGGMPNAGRRSLADDDLSLGGSATYGGRSVGPSSEVSLGGGATLGDKPGEQETVIDDIEVVDLEARYRIEGTLGRGGMGEVLLAVDTRLDRKVAIKRILGEAARGKTALERFRNEAKALAKLNHPNVVTIYDSGYAKDGPFLVMEYVEGRRLLDRCRDGAMPEEEAVDLICQLCDGLATAHDSGIVHRDIKPANVLLTKSGVPKLTDFGLVKTEASNHQMTMAGAVLGTPDFMPPEQRRDAAEVDVRSDLWSLAATLYQMVTGRSPKVIRLHELPQSLQSILGRALEDEKDARYQSASDFRDALRQPKNGSTPAGFSQPSVATDALQEGQCKACGAVTSDLTKKFCRNPACGASLRINCLKCESSIPVWDGVCGECGGKQPTLLEAQRKHLLAKQSKAEELVRAFAFKDALKIGTELAKVAHPDLAEIAAWGNMFVESIAVEQGRQQAVTAERLLEAEAHVAACDYPAAILSLEVIPKPLRVGKAVELWKRCVALKNESDSLIATIWERTQRKDLDGLIPVVEAAMALRRDRKDIAKIYRQLVESIDRRIASAHAFMAAGDANSAAAVLVNVAESDLNLSQKHFTRQVRATKKTEDRRVKAVRKIVDVINMSHQRIACQIEAVVQNRKCEKLLEAKARAASFDYDAAIQLISTMPSSLRSGEVARLLVACTDQARESTDLIPIIANRVKQKDLEGLLPLVERALTLRGDRKDLAKLHGQLVERRDGRFRRGYAAIDAGDAKAAAAVFAEAAMQDFSPNQQKLIDRVRNAAALEEQIVVLIKDAKAYAKLPPEKAAQIMVAGQRYLSLNPRNRRVADVVAKSRRLAEPFLRKQVAATLASPAVRNSIGVELKLLPAGIFTMGQVGSDRDEKPHQVALTKDFYIGIYPVTNVQWARVMKCMPGGRSANHPVVNVSWEDACEFCSNLSALPEEIAAGRVYRLPTEAEWEYACRAGSTTQYSFGDDESRLGEYAWFSKNSGSETHSVGQRKPNSWGLFDMHGNVLEWCSDWYEFEYGSDDATDPQGPTEGSFRVFRGGGWDFSAWGCRSADRYGDDPSIGDFNLGFRLALSPSGSKPPEAGQ